MTMSIVVNGDPRRVPEGQTVAQLVSELALEGKRIAIEINQEIVPRSQFPARRLQSGDRVEVVTAIGGG